MRFDQSPAAILEHIARIAGRIDGIYTEDLAPAEPFETTAARFAAESGTVALMSGGDLDCARYHILGVRPWLSFNTRYRNATVVLEHETLTTEADPLDLLRRLMTHYRLDQAVETDLPFGAGFLGYFSYDLKDMIEKLPRTSVDDLALPHLCLYAPSVVLVHDRHASRTRLCLPRRIRDGQPVWETALEGFRRTMSGPPASPGTFSGNRDGLRSGFTRPEYEDAISRIREYIAAGHVYQVNMSQRFQTDFQGDPFALFQTLFRKNPAPFFAYVHAGDHFLVSTSPERFMAVRGTEVETRPIKGTRPRGSTLEEDDKNRRELEESDKDQAELSMIVDLLRNDLGKVCRAGTVKVREHKRLEAYQNVYHLVSIVTGERSPEHDLVDLIQAAFPGGSITGCPKIRSMEIIDEMEPVRRHAYTGSIGYLSFHDTMDLSIAIRTAIIAASCLYVSVGGGIVYDSDPGEEYEETLHKGRTLMTVFDPVQSRPPAEPVIWLNGRFLPASRGLVPALGWGFQYGFGFFETIRADQGRPRLLAGHLARFHRTWDALFSVPRPDVTWEAVIAGVLEQSGLDRETAAVKILAALQSDHPGVPETSLLVTARPYRPRWAAGDRPSLALVTYPHPRQTPLADHKTLNYLYYFLAGRWAAVHGGQEALILNPDGSLSETNTANILVVKGRSVVSPLSPHVLPGVMEERIRAVLTAWGYTISNTPLFPEDLRHADEVWLTNALMGAVPAASLDGRPLPGPSDLWINLNQAV